MKNFIFWMVLGFCIIISAGCGSGQMRAGATLASQTFVLPSTPSITYDTNTYILLFDMATGDFVTAATGAVSASTAWSAADIATAAHANNTAAYTATIPELSSNYEYIMTVWSGTNYSTSDTFQAGPWLYDPRTNKTSTDANPQSGNKVLTQIRND